MTIKACHYFQPDISPLFLKFELSIYSLNSKICAEKITRYNRYENYGKKASHTCLLYQSYKQIYGYLNLDISAMPTFVSIAHCGKIDKKSGYVI